MTVGVDLGDRWSRFCVIDEHGEVLEQDTIATTGRALRKRFGPLRWARLALVRQHQE